MVEGLNCETSMSIERSMISSESVVEIARLDRVSSRKRSSVWSRLERLGQFDQAFSDSHGSHRWQFGGLLGSSHRTTDQTLRPGESQNGLAAADLVSFPEHDPVFDSTIVDPDPVGRFQVPEPPVVAVRRQFCMPSTDGTIRQRQRFR